MLRSLLLLLLLVGGAQASHFYGTVMTYYPKNTSADGSLRVVARYKLSFRSCTDDDTWSCTGNCGTESVVLNEVQELSGEWCQREGIMTRQLTNNAPFQLQLDGGDWINNIDSLTTWRAVTAVELRNRSDTGQANRSPQTTILPALRVPSNCPRDFNLLVFDPDGDEVKCRIGNSPSECNSCTLPSTLRLSSLCTLSYSPVSTQGAYAIQLVMEDFPRQTITLTATNGTQVSLTTNNAISKLPVQFAVRVDAAVLDCTEGLYLPKFLPPTPANGARLYTPVNQPLEIRISAQANISTISELLFSGPHNTNRTTDAGQFVLRWTPSADEDGESHPFCFVVQATGTATYHSELRCLIVSVGIDPTATTIQPTTTTTTTPATTTTTPATTTTTPAPTTTTPAPTTTTPATTTTTPATTTTTPTPTTMTPATTTTTPAPATMAPAPTTTTPAPTTTTPATTTTTPATTTTTPATTTTTPAPTTTTPAPTTTTTAPTTPDPNQFVIGLRARISSLFPLSEEDIRTIIIQQLKDELRRQGLSSAITLRLVSSMELALNTTATPVVTT